MSEALQQKLRDAHRLLDAQPVFSARPQNGRSAPIWKRLLAYIIEDATLIGAAISSLLRTYRPSTGDSWRSRS